MTSRSFWAWGHENKLPDEPSRRLLAAQISALLGVDLQPRPLPRIEDAKVPSPRFDLPRELASFSSPRPGDRITHTYGKAYRDIVRAFRLDFAPAPDCVVFPNDEQDVQAALAFASHARVCVVPFGGGTSVTGGVECACPEGYRGVMSLDLRAMDRVLEVDPVSRAALVQAGATGPALEEQLAARGFTLRHFPQSFEFSTLGGWIATRAGGHYATLATRIDDLVESVRMITPRGAWETRRLPASGAGPSADRLAIGSEGILGVITRAWLRVVPRPRWRASASVHYASFEAGVDACRALAQSGLYPSNARLLDAREAMLHRVSGDGTSVLLIGFESADHELGAWMSRALAITTSFGGVCPAGATLADDQAKARANEAATSWRRAFFDAPYMQSALVTLGVIADTFETACTWDLFPKLHENVQRRVTEAMKRACGSGILTCRFTHVYPDGPAPYYTFLAPGRAAEELEQWDAIKRAASDVIHESGATITHHHAVGRMHRPWYDKERPELFADALRAAKRAVDPAFVLNPGVLVDP